MPVLNFGGMSKLAAEKRASRMAELAKLSPDERVALALALGRRDVELLCQAEGISEEQARRRFRAQRQRGRQPCSFLSPDAKSA